MRLAIVFSVWVLLATTSLLNAAQSSETRDLPPLKLAATDLDAILTKAHALIAAANGPVTGQESARESVKLGVSGHEIEIPHFSMASSVAFPKEVFRFSYTYYQSDKPISSVTVDLGDYSRRVAVRGEAADQVTAVSNLLENDLCRYSTTIGGVMFRRVAGVCLSVVLLISLIFSIGYWWNTRLYSALGMLICSALGLSLVLLVRWDRYLPGFALYQSYSPFFLVRHASEISVLALLATLAGIPFSYFVARNRSKGW
jgi:hypothetical protein